MKKILMMSALAGLGSSAGGSRPNNRRNGQSGDAAH